MIAFVTQNKIAFVTASKRCRLSGVGNPSFKKADIGSDNKLVMADIKIKLGNKKRAASNSESIIMLTH